MKRQTTLGLSQLELMVSLAVMGLLALLLVNTMSFVRMGLERSGAISDDVVLAANREQIRTIGETMSPIYGDGTAQDILSGSAASLSMRGVVPNPSGIGQIDVQIELGLSSHVVEMQLLPVVQQTEIAPRILAHDAAVLSISYYGRTKDAPEKQWFDHWNDETYLPDLVKIEIELSDGSPLPPITFVPAKRDRQSDMSLSSLLPPT